MKKEHLPVLDEVGELPAEAQAKLLRALQEGEINRVGSEQHIAVDVRVLAATNRNLEEEVNQGSFRKDLYYRLKVVELECPPLRDRLEDLPALAQYFIEYYSRKLGKPVLGIAPSTLKLLSSYSWPGNIRELENMIERAVALAETSVLGQEDFVFPELKHIVRVPKKNSEATSTFETLLDICELSSHDFKKNGWEKLLKSCERICLEAMLLQFKNQKDTAEALDLTPTKLHRLLKKHGLKK
jgi:transcriptional regulator with GAF, ATPase, and Fis domain